MSCAVRKQKEKLCPNPRYESTPYCYPHYIEESCLRFYYKGHDSDFLHMKNTMGVMEHKEYHDDLVIAHQHASLAICARRLHGELFWSNDLDDGHLYRIQHIKGERGELKEHINSIGLGYFEDDDLHGRIRGELLAALAKLDLKEPKGEVKQEKQSLDNLVNLMNIPELQIFSKNEDDIITREGLTKQDPRLQVPTQQAPTQQAPAQQATAQQATAQQASTQEASTQQTSTQQASTQETSMQQDPTQQTTTQQTTTQQTTTQQDSAQQATTQESPTQQGPIPQNIKWPAKPVPGQLEWGKVISPDYNWNA
ncbi:hypothetical protein F4677DRAFT_451180 [Hypoxylon crocopeplum]|nr:hypothetical protein F4677DRAFT_451180 [Hypoxylon crocopeplum]